MSAGTAPTTVPRAIDGYREWMRVAEAEYRRFADAISAIPHDGWTAQTDCELWDVRAMAGHVIGTMRANASMREQVSQQREIKRRAKQSGELETDVMTQVQIDRTADLSTADLVAEYHSNWPRALKGRSRVPGIVRKAVKLPIVIGPLDEKWELGFLLGPIFTRDLWMHRVDLSRALGVPIALTADHDGRIVEDVVAEWAGRHGKPYSLRLTGEAGGQFGSDSASPSDHVEIDAVEFCRVLSGRAEHAHPLVQTFVPF